MLAPLRAAALSAALTALPLLPAHATGFVMGSGQWTCGDVLAVAQRGNELQRGQLFGWILGYWSAVSFSEEDSFAEVMSEAGGQNIANITIAECGRQPADAPLYLVTQGIVANSIAEAAAAQEGGE